MAERRERKQTNKQTTNIDENLDRQFDFSTKLLTDEFRSRESNSGTHFEIFQH